MDNLKNFNREERIKKILENGKNNPEYRKMVLEKTRKIMEEKARQSKNN